MQYNKGSKIVYEQVPLAGFEAHTQVQPLFRWAGGKRALLKHLLQLVPHDFNNYYEPFVGAGALYFALQPSAAVLSDSNQELINCYEQVRDHTEEVICCLSALQNTEEEYYRIRDWLPTGAIPRAARFLYLASLSFNGIYRVNSEGKFNVPYSNRQGAIVCDATRIRTVGAALAKAQLRCCDFADSLASAAAGDLIYLDPPYTVAHGNNGFIEYNAKIFSWSDQERLAKLALELVERGCTVLVSNADHSSILDLYQKFRVMKVTRNSSIAASASNRKHVTECIFYNEVTQPC